MQFAFFLILHIVLPKKDVTSLNASFFTKTNLKYYDSRTKSKKTN